MDNLLSFSPEESGEELLHFIKYRRTERWTHLLPPLSNRVHVEALPVLDILDRLANSPLGPQVCLPALTDTLLPRFFLQGPDLADDLGEVQLAHVQILCEVGESSFQLVQPGQVFWLKVTS